MRPTRGSCSDIRLANTSTAPAGPSYKCRTRLRYCSTVPRLIPRFTAAKAQIGQVVAPNSPDSPSGFSLVLYRKHREYNAAIGAALLYLSLLYLRPMLEALLHRFR